MNFGLYGVKIRPLIDQVRNILLPWVQTYLLTSNNPPLQGMTWWSMCVQGILKYPTYPGCIRSLSWNNEESFSQKKSIHWNLNNLSPRKFKWNFHLIVLLTYLLKQYSYLVITSPNNIPKEKVTKYCFQGTASKSSYEAALFTHFCEKFAGKRIIINCWTKVKWSNKISNGATSAPASSNPRCHWQAKIFFIWHLSHSVSKIYEVIVIKHLYLKSAFLLIFPPDNL